MRGRMLSADRAYPARETTFDNELEWLAAEFYVNGMEYLPAPSEIRSRQRVECQQCKEQCSCSRTWVKRMLYSEAPPSRVPESVSASGGQEFRRPLCRGDRASFELNAICLSSVVWVSGGRSLPGKSGARSPWVGARRAGGAP